MSQTPLSPEDSAPAETPAASPHTSETGQPAATPPASDAQQQLRSLVETVQTLREQLDALRREAAGATIAHAVSEALRAGGVLDPAAARPLLEALLPSTPQPADIAAAIKLLRTRRPGLFRAAAASAMSARVETDQPADTAARAAHDARATGSRRSLLEYLRLRRAARP